ncbi:hypothetical protein [Halobellus salinus]|nr:hypothetical protein [Halobellus salinus]SMP17544.1 hypothetical protein SAMN06265347_10685 [Halobellus salinus]
MLQTLRPAGTRLRQPAPLTFRSIAVTTLVILALVAAVALAVQTGVVVFS